MQLIKFLVILVVLSSTLSCTAQKKPTKKVSQHYLVEVKGNYQKINRVEDVPSVITNYFGKQKFDRDMVGPEGEFNGSRGTKLLRAGNAGEIWFIDFLMGGTGLSQTFLAFRVNEGKILSILEIDHTKTHPKSFIQLTITELESKLPTRPVCVKKHDDYLQYIYETGYGVCPPQYLTKE
jgi:hypothetical protein